MPIDLDAFPPEMKLAFIVVGEGFGSEDTYAQATQTLQGLEKYAGTLKLYGLPLSDNTRLQEAQDMLSEAGFGRAEAKSKKKALGAGLEEALKTARTVRVRGRSVLTSTKSGLLEKGASQAATDVQSVLDTTSDSERIGDELAAQLDQLAGALDPKKAVEAADVASDRGGPETLSALTAAAAALRAAAKKKPAARGTPEETQRIDHIDGIIVDIARRARDAAEAASKDLGDPAILKAFKLDKLYASRGGAKKEDKPAGDPAAPGTAAPKPAGTP